MAEGVAARAVCGRCRSLVDREHGELTGHPTFLVAEEWQPPAPEDARAWRRVAAGRLVWQPVRRPSRPGRRRPRLPGFGLARGGAR